jgi:SAM-dependent methyltransferase
MTEEGSDPSAATLLGGGAALPVTDAEAAQKAHYNRIATAFEAHYDDSSTRQYRDRFVDGPLFEGLDLQGRQVLEAMCGGGLTTPGLLARGAHVTGIDISDACIESFRARWPQCRAVCASITNSGLPSESFDAVAVVGGLHHLQPNLDPAVDEIHRLLRPGGSFCFFEPHTGSLPDWFRQRWYRRDVSMFSRNEAAIDIDDLKAKYARHFDFAKEQYCGNLAFLLVYNSMIFRIPLALKPWYTTALLRMEASLNRLQGRRLACVVIGQWRKK